MTSANHIAGGIAITGISLSFWDINIFSNSAFLATTIFASLLPDIDHTKSIIGKLFYPIARAIDRKYGHRTITHSLTFFVPVLMFVVFLELNFLNPFFDRSGAEFSMIFGFAMFSHFILDMLTVQGIPLFFPFMRNPCVIPANPNFRIRSGDFKSEAIAMSFFVITIFSSYDLFANGFWTSYNRSFGTIMHAEREFRRSENFVNIDYSYLLNGEPVTGKGILLDASEKHLELFENDKIHRISNEDQRVKNIQIAPTKGEFPFKIETLNFAFLTVDQLNDTLQGKIISGNIFGNQEFIFNNVLIKSELKLNKEISPKIETLRNEAGKDKIKAQIAIQEAKLREIQAQNSIQVQERSKLEKSLEKALNSLKTEKDLYASNKLEKEIIDIRHKLDIFQLKQTPVYSIIEEIKQLSESLEIEEKTYFSGTVNFYVIPEKSLQEFPKKENLSAPPKKHILVQS